MAVKGGTLMSALFGIAERTTMDIDTTILDFPGDEASIHSVIQKICKIDISDGIAFSVDASKPITKDDTYGGYGFSLMATIGTIRLSLGIDVTVGDVVTPAPERLEFKNVMGDTGNICLLAYTTETVLAEKLQTVLKRGALTTRPRDFYDIHKIVTAKMFRPEILRNAIRATFQNRNSTDLIPKREEIVNRIHASAFIRDQWMRYQKQFTYAKSITLETVLGSVTSLFPYFPAATRKS